MTRIFNADVNELTGVIDYLDDTIKVLNPGFRQTKKLELALEECFVNIVSYAYPNGEGQVQIDIDIDEAKKTVSVTLTDDGIPFDPLSEKDPDVTLPAAKRKVGGLGIFLVKKNTDEQHYEYRDSKNIMNFKTTLTSEA